MIYIFYTIQQVVFCLEIQTPFENQKIFFSMLVFLNSKSKFELVISELLKFKY